MIYIFYVYIEKATIFLYEKLQPVIEKIYQYTKNLYNKLKLSFLQRLNEIFKSNRQE